MDEVVYVGSYGNPLEGGYARLLVIAPNGSHARTMLQKELAAKRVHVPGASPFGSRRHGPCAVGHNIIV